MWEPLTLIGRIPEEKFAEVYSACPRKIRNYLEGMFAKKIRKGGRKVALKTARDRVLEALAVRDGIQAEGNTQMAEEVLKTWLYTKRPMLKATLDFFGVPNEDGITTKDLDALEKAEPARLDELIDHLAAGGFPLAEVAVYLAFLKVERFAEVPRLVEVLGRPEGEGSTPPAQT